MVKLAVVDLPLVWPVATRPNWPGARLGTLKLRLKPPDVSAVGEPIELPLKETFTVSPGWKPEPLMTTEPPAAACAGDSESPAAGVAGAAGVVAAEPGVVLVALVVVVPLVVGVPLGVSVAAWPKALPA